MKDLIRTAGRFLLFVILVFGAMISCSTQKKIREIRENGVTSSIGLPKEREYVPQEVTVLPTHRDTIQVVGLNGEDLFLMPTVIVDGEEMAGEVLDAVYVTALFRNVAERNGKVNIEFQIIVPETLMDSKWQLRYQPTMFVLEDTVLLDKVFVTGKEYRARQLRGYERYQDFLDKIIYDTTLFIQDRRLEHFIRRNIPELYRFKNDSSFVSDEQWSGVFGVTEQEAINHYTNRFKIRLNNWRKSRIQSRYEKYIKAPIITEGLRLDTVLTINGNYVYNYSQELDVRSKSKLRRVDIILDGEVYEQGECLYEIPTSDTLTIYISSLSAFVDPTERYVKRVIERRAEANANYNIEFETGRADVLTDFRNNAQEIELIKQQLLYLLDNKEFDLDSVVVLASASPEGSVELNSNLAKRRSESITRYFNQYMNRTIDSLRMEEGMMIDESGEMRDLVQRQPISFLSRFLAEDWISLAKLIDRDTVMDVTQKEEFYALYDIEDMDARENRMKRESWYQHMKDDLYPELRSVKFDFVLHRKDMIKDTIQTTVLDSVYMAGVQAIRDREYELAADLLYPYNDYNTAIAFSALDRNRSALAILEAEDMPKTAEVNYMLAILYSRFGEDEKAVQYYINSCSQNPSYVSRGNLDPEISVLINRYGLNKQDDDYEYDY